MIKLLRVDHRLLHGQVGFVWANALNADAILIANDSAATDQFRKTAIKLAKPSGVKLVINTLAKAINVINAGKTDQYNLLIVVENIKDAHKLALNCDRVTSINLGGSKHTEDSKQLSKAFYLAKDEETYVQDILNKGIEVEVRQLPNDNKKIIDTI